MSEKPSPLLPDDEQTRDRLRAALAVCCAVALVLAGMVVPALSAGGLGQSPLASVVPQPDANPYDQGGGGGNGLGALNPGDSTSVGGSLAGEDSPFRSQSAETHFTVQSSDPAYWRTGAYDTYTGSGWERSGDRQPYTGPLDGGGDDDGGGDRIRGERVEYRVALDRSATALPSVWRAESISQTDADSLFVTDQGAFVTDDPLPAGTTYSGVSHLPPQDPTVLKTAGRDYPAEVERRYADLPADTDREVARFTDDLTQDADSPYESAEQIESWLETNKDYSLNVSEPGEDVASEFIFEMEEGYCEYFATSMTVMLRSQDVPARYVVGYSTGQQVGENTYRVRELNAHAWVEAYFPDVGWVKFDPTPGRDRLEAEQDAVRNQTDSRYEPSEPGSPGEELSPNQTSDEASTTGPSDDATTTDTSSTEDGPPTDSGSATTSGESGTATAANELGTATTDGTGATTQAPGEETTATTTTGGDGDGDEPGDDPDGPPSEGDYEVELNRTPVPGATVEATILRNGTPASDLAVAFNDEFVGYTGVNGTVVGEVPYARSLRITVGEGDSRETDSLASPPAELDASILPDPDASIPLDLDASIPPDLDAPMALDGGPLRALLQENQTNETDSGGTEYSLSTNATVAVSGDVTTDSEVVVTATVENVPVRNGNVQLDGERVATTDEDGRARVRLPDSPGNATIEISRGEVSGETTVSIPNLTVFVEPALPVALPGTPVEVRVSYGGDPLSNASVAVGERNETTDLNGTASATLPFQRSAAVVVSAHGQTRRTTVSGLFVNLLGLLGGIAVVLGGLGWGLYRRELGPGRLAGLLTGTLRALPRLAVAALFGVADRLEWTFQTISDALRELRTGETTVGELLARLRTWLNGRALAAREGARWVGDGPAAKSRPDRDDDSYRTLREAWQTFLDSVSIRRPAAMTPAELATHAVREDDLPPGAVATLRDAFRDVEYGARSPADRLARVEEAVETIERATRETEDGIRPEESSEAESPDTGGET